jgi:hypothetical protein
LKKPKHSFFLYDTLKDSILFVRGKNEKTSVCDSFFYAKPFFIVLRDEAKRNKYKKNNSRNDFIG